LKAQTLRIKKKPYKLNGYWYLTKYETGKDYPIYLRKKETLDAEEEILFDCNQLAKEHAYFNLGGISISPDNTLAAFSIDTVSRRQYTLQIKNLITGEVYHETDETFNTFVYKTKSKSYIVIGASSTLSSEYRFLNADNPNGNFKILQERTKDLEYNIAHYKDSFYIISNADKATNFKISKTSENKPEKENWQDIIPHRPSVLIEDIEIFKDYLVIKVRWIKPVTSVRLWLLWINCRSVFF